MKKAIFAAFLCFVIVSVSNAQAFNKGDNLLSVGLGVGTPYFGAGYSAGIPVNPTITFERGITDDISVGGTGSFATTKYNGYLDNYTESAIYIGARGAYHFNRLLNLSIEKLDLYAGAGVGYVVVSASDGANGVSAAAGGAGFGVFAGGRYYFAEKIGAYAELGYTSLSLLNVGITFKF